MKTFISIFLVLICLPLQAKFKISGWNMDVQVLSNTFDPSIPVGQFKVYGEVRLQRGGGTPDGATICNRSVTIAALSDSAGAFSVFFPVSDTVIYCFKEGFDELLLKGPFESRRAINVLFYLDAQEYSDQPVTKPVIYAYNAASEFQLTIKPVHDFTFTYPMSVTEGQWRAKTNSDGSLTDMASGNSYPYLFWEGLGKNIDFVVSKNEFMENRMQGHLVKTDTCVAFLENILRQYGLNEKEKTDFITWWVPQMIVKDYVLVQFLTNDAYEDVIAGIDVQPTPLSMLRLYVLVFPLDGVPADLKIEAPLITPFNRIGFTIVEWGGTVLDHSRLLY